VFQHRQQQPEEPLVVFRRRQELLGHLRQEIENNPRRIIRLQLEWRSNQLARVQSDQLPVLPLEVERPDVREPFQARAKTALGPSRTPRYAPQFSFVPGEKAHYEVCFPEWVRAEY
jgi:hypothetical protein